MRRYKKPITKQVQLVACRTTSQKGIISRLPPQRRRHSRDQFARLFHQLTLNSSLYINYQTERLLTLCRLKLSLACSVVGHLLEHVFAVDRMLNEFSILKHFGFSLAVLVDKRFSLV